MLRYLGLQAVTASSEWEAFGGWRHMKEAKRVHPHRQLVANHQGFAA